MVKRPWKWLKRKSKKPLKRKDNAIQKEKYRLFRYKIMSPFVSLAQARFMYKNKPEMAKEWSSKTNWKKLPQKVKTKNAKKKKR